MLSIYLALINLICFLLFGLDKYRARHGGRRISEKHLFILALAGGTAGALLGMHFFRHKTLHHQFTIGLPLILLIQVYIGFYANFKIN